MDRGNPQKSRRSRRQLFLGQGGGQALGFPSRYKLPTLHKLQRLSRCHIPSGILGHPRKALLAHLNPPSLSRPWQP